MYHPVDDLVAEARAAAAPQEANVPDVKVGPTDATLGLTSFKKAEAVFVRLLTYGRSAALAGGVLWSAWMAGSYFSGGQSQFSAMKTQPSPTFVAQESGERAELVRIRQKMTDDIRALQARVEAIPAARSPSAKDATVLEELKRRLDAVERETAAALAELAGKVGRMQREATAKSSQAGEQRNQTQRQIAAPSRAVDSELAVLYRSRPGNGAAMSSIHLKSQKPQEFLARLEAPPTTTSINATGDQLLLLDPAHLNSMVSASNTASFRTTCCEASTGISNSMTSVRR